MKVDSSDSLLEELAFKFDFSKIGSILLNGFRQMNEKQTENHLETFTKILYNVLFFNIFSIEELSDIVKEERLIKWKMYKNGKMIFKEGTFDQHFYIVIRGTVDIYNSSLGKVGSVRKGEIFGEKTICDPGKPRTSSAYAGQGEGVLLCEFDGTILDVVSEELKIKFLKKFIDISLSQLANIKSKQKYYQSILDFSKQNGVKSDNEYFLYTVRTSVSDNNLLTQYVKYTDYLISEKIDSKKLPSFLENMRQNIANVLEALNKY